MLSNDESACKRTGNDNVKTNLFTVPEIVTFIKIRII